MASFSGFGRAASAAILIGAVMFAASVRAQDVNDEHMQAARKAIASIGLTDRFDTILPGLAERLKAQLIQAYPNFVDEISTTVDQQAIALAARRADLEKEAAQVYAKSFTVEELNAISTFYNSEAGKKFLKDRPLADREVLKAADIWASGIARDLNQQSNAELMKSLGPEAQGGDAVAPATNP